MRIAIMVGNVVFVDFSPKPDVFSRMAVGECASSYQRTLSYPSKPTVYNLAVRPKNTR